MLDVSAGPLCGATTFTTTLPVAREQMSGRMFVACELCKAGDCPNLLVLCISPCVAASTGTVVVVAAEVVVAVVVLAFIVVVAVAVVADTDISCCCCFTWRVFVPSKL